MINQTYQDLTRVIARDLIKLGNNKLNQVSKDFQDYFYKAKQENPKRYAGMTFDTNGHKPYSSDLESILTSLRGNLIGTRLYIKKEKISLYKE